MKLWALMCVALLSAVARADTAARLPGTIDAPAGWTALRHNNGLDLDVFKGGATRDVSVDGYAAPDGSGRLVVIRLTAAYGEVSRANVQKIENVFLSGAFQTKLTPGKPLEQVSDSVYLVDQVFTGKDGGVRQHHLRLYRGDTHGLIHVFIAICVGVPDVPSSCEASLATAKLQVDEPALWNGYARKYNATNQLAKVIGFVALAGVSACVTVLLLRKPRTRRSRRR